jgi:hypothetical protein
MAFEFDNAYSNSVQRIAQEDLEVTALEYSGVGAIGIKCSLRPITIVYKPFYTGQSGQPVQFTNLQIGQSNEVVILDTNILVGDIVSIQYFF